MIARYFAYGSNMNPDRVRERGILFKTALGARLVGYRLAFNKSSTRHMGVGHANIVFDPAAVVEGVLYWLDGPAEMQKMDRFESTPVNYSRDIVEVATEQGPQSSWTYFANPAVLVAGLKPPRSYLNHLLAAREYLSPAYYEALAGWECVEER